MSVPIEISTGASELKAAGDENGTSVVAPADGQNGDSPHAEGPLAVLRRLAAGARLFRAGDGALHARVPVGRRCETYRVRSEGFRDWLIDRFFAERHEPPAPAAIARVVSLLEARARFDDKTPAAFIRVALVKGEKGVEYLVDLRDATGRAIKITARGWELVEQHYVPVEFERPKGLLPLPVPERGGSLQLLRPYVNVRDDDFLLLIAWLTAPSPGGAVPNTGPSQRARVGQEHDGQYFGARDRPASLPALGPADKHPRPHGDRTQRLAAVA